MPENDQYGDVRHDRQRPNRKYLVGAVVAVLALLAALLVPRLFSDDGSPTTPTPGPSTSRPTASAAPARLTRSGNTLMLDGKPFRYVGVNAYGLNGQETGHPYTRAQIDSLFAALPTATVTRTWAWPARKVDSLVPVIESAEAHNQLLILSLSEGAGFSPAGKRTAAWYESGYKDELLPWIDEVVPRFKNSRAVGMWEIMNEPGNRDATDGEVPPAVMKDFFDTVAARIKEHDPNHLVETGTMDSSQSGTQDWVALNSSDKIDVLSIHEYADEYENGILVSKHYTDVVAATKKLNKPIIIGEVGVRGSDVGCLRTREQRVDLLRRKFDAYFAAGVSGINLWNWFPDKKDDCKSGQNLYNGDPAMQLLRDYRPMDVRPAPSGSSGTSGTNSPSTGSVGGTAGPSGSASSDSWNSWGTATGSASTTG